jgi:hypothetical protein
MEMRFLFFESSHDWVVVRVLVFWSCVPDVCSSVVAFVCLCGKDIL